jgi:MFS family permease
MADQQTAPLSRTGRLAILGGGILPAIASGTIAVMLPAIADAFGAGGVQVKMVSTALGLGMLFGAMAGGALADRVGRRLLLIGAAAIFGVVGCGVMLTSALWQVIAARFVIGLASGAMGVGMAAVIGDHFEGHARSRWIGFNTAVATFFMLAANPLVGALVDRSWRYGFALYALAIPVLLTIVIGVPKGRRRARPGGGAPRGVSGLSVSALILAVMVGTLATGTSLYWPFRFREVGVDLARDMAVYALPNALMVGVAALSYGLIRRALSISQVFLVAAVTSCLGLVAMGLATQPWMIAAGLAVEGCAIGMLTPNLTAFALTVSPPAWLGRNLGLVKAALYGSPFVTQFFLEPLNRLGGASFSLWGIAAMAAILALAVVTGKLGRTTPHPAAA